jgi:hypothetical protein
MEVSYRFSRMEDQGLTFGNGDFSDEDALELFTFVPIERTAEAHLISLAFGATEDVTVSVTAGWTVKKRVLVNDEVIFSTDARGMTDLQADALWQVYSRGAWRGHVQMGLIVPTGSIEEQGDFPASGDFGEATGVQLPYDMQIGSGSVTLVPGLAAQVMNEVGSVGGQVRGYFPVTDNDRDWRPGNRLDARVWLARRFNDHVSASTGVRASVSNAISGSDPALETLRDPGDLALSFATQRVDLPIGINFRLTEGPFAGHRIGAEAFWTVHQNTDGPQIAADWGFSVGWQMELGLGAPGM